jgi:putative ribosome biogenesis GTPase RsgA
MAEWLAPWLAAGTTLVVVGSSGVGKSTVVNRGNRGQSTDFANILRTKKVRLNWSGSLR